MDKKKIRVGIICGGESAEHEVSLLSARNIYTAYDTSRFSASLLYIDRQDGWFYIDPVTWIQKGVLWDLHPSAPRHQIQIDMQGKPRLYYESEGKKIYILLDVCFPIVHGSDGEDGSLQGMLQMLHLPYIGASSGISYLCMDKHYMKIIADAMGIETAPYLLCHKDASNDLGTLFREQKKAASMFPLPLFVKPCRQGSSVGVSKVTKMEDLQVALCEAFRFDDKALIEKGIDGREIEIAMLGQGQTNIQASNIGEIRAVDNFYSYKRKYLVEDEAELIVPASFAATEKKQIQEYAKQIYRIFEIQGMARIDMFYTAQKNCYLNEINTLPGFTNISMYPKLWENSGISQCHLLTKLTELAMDAGKQYQERKGAAMFPDPT